MLAGVRLAHPCPYQNEAYCPKKAKKDGSTRNSRYRKHIDNTPYPLIIKDSYARIADNMSSLEQYVLLCASFHDLHLSLDL